jgi:hypothetical protein
MNIESWKYKFGLGNWVIQVKIDPTLKQNAKTIADPRYQRATIFLQKEDLGEEFDRVVIHELIHIIMSMYDFYVDNKVKDSDIIQVARENAVSQLGEIFIRNWGDDHV